MTRRLTRCVLAVLLFPAVLGVAGCACSRIPEAETGASAPALVASGTADVSAPAAASDAAAPDAGGDGTRATKSGASGLSASDAKAIEAELSAIEKQLDTMSMPDDRDFGGIESGLK